MKLVQTWTILLTHQLYSYQHHLSFVQVSDLESEMKRNLLSFFLASGCGKTRFLSLLLSQKLRFSNNFDKIWLFVESKQDAHQRIIDAFGSDKVTLVYGLNMELLSDPKKLCQGKGFTAVILDDLQLEIEGQKRIVEYFTKFRSNYQISIFVLVQNLFSTSRELRLMLRNAQYFTVCKDLRLLSSLKTYAAQLLGDKKLAAQLVAAFKSSFNDYKYLIIDQRPSVDLRHFLFSGILDGEEEIYYTLPSLLSPL